MQTFLPYASFRKSAQVLDNKRLGKQRVEALQIMYALTRKEYGWKNHPATKMWRGCEFLLACYGLDMCVEWRRRGFRDNCMNKFQTFMRDLPMPPIANPLWLGDKRLHASHRSNLLRKDAQFYGQYGWSESDNLAYYWANETS